MRYCKQQSRRAYDTNSRGMSQSRVGDDLAYTVQYYAQPSTIITDSLHCHLSFDNIDSATSRCSNPGRHNCTAYLRLHVPAARGSFNETTAAPFGFMCSMKCSRSAPRKDMPPPTRAA
eukprot:6208981-Pleurochrysis_carterae.AAC.4